MAHTSHTGTIVGSATLTRIDKKNDSSGAKMEISMGHGEITWIPKANLTMAFKYNHKDKNATTPAAVTVVDRTNSANTYTYASRPAVSSTTDTAAALLRYRPFRRFTLKSAYTRQSKKLGDKSPERWFLPRETIKDTMEVGFAWRTPRHIKATGRLIYTTARHLAEKPIMNFEPEESTQGILSVTWLPSPWITALLNCNISRDSSDDLRIMERSYVNVENVHHAETLNQRFLASVTMQMTEKLTLTESYAYIATDNDRDLAYDAFLPAKPFVDHGYSSKIKAHNVALNLTYLPTAKLTLNALFDYTAANGMYYPTTPAALTPVSIGIFSNTATEEITLGLDGRYKLSNGWSADVDLRLINWDDDSFDSPNNGRYFATTIKAIKQW